MIYSLKCGTCLEDNNVSGSDETIFWLCVSCGEENSTSVPMTPSGELITDYTKAKSILSPTASKNAPDMVVASVVSFEESLAFDLGVVE